jgi:hypothetical protein
MVGTLLLFLSLRNNMGRKNKTKNKLVMTYVNKGYFLLCAQRTPSDW